MAGGRTKGGGRWERGRERARGTNVEGRWSVDDDGEVEWSDVDGR